MTPLTYRIVWTLSVVTFSFGALAFSTLALFYWRQRRTQKAADRVFPAFTLVCAAAFLINLAQQADADLEWVAPVLGLITGMVPALIVHLVASEERSGPRWLPAVCYFAAGGLAVAVAMAWALGIVGTLVILKICHALTGVRADKQAEIEGLDLSMHGEEGYNFEG